MESICKLGEIPEKLWDAGIISRSVFVVLEYLTVSDRPTDLYRRLLKIPEVTLVNLNKELDLKSRHILAIKETDKITGYKSIW